eukprot:1161780-Pelagomonas_calceolata.AAC.7
MQQPALKLGPRVRLSQGLPETKFPVATGANVQQLFHGSPGFTTLRHQSELSQPPFSLTA